MAAVDDAIRRTRRQLQDPHPVVPEGLQAGEERGELLWPGPADDDDTAA